MMSFMFYMWGNIIHHVLIFHVVLRYFHTNYTRRERQDENQVEQAFGDRDAVGKNDMHRVLPKGRPDCQSDLPQARC
jgi:hypothetical protein